MLTGSPRKGGNSDKLADAFIAGAQKAGHTAVKFTTADKNIKGCRNCMTCYSTGTACSFQDDFNSLAPMVEQADMLVFATPLYWYSFPSQLKAAIDKFFSFMTGNRSLKIKECALLVCSGDKIESGFDGIIASYRLIANQMKWHDSGIITAPGLFAKDDILNSESLKKAEAMGLAI